MARAYVGTSGWNYDWHRFYGEVPGTQRLRYCGTRFTGLEINATHYRLQSAETLARWGAAVPEDFRFALKAHRFLTHNKKLLDVADSLPRSREPALALGEKLAVILWQLPAKFHKNAERLRSFAAALGERWRDHRHALELRHQSWFDDEIAACLEEHEIAVCLSDAPDFPMWDRVTTDLVYVRLHGHTRKYASRYATRSLRAWAARVEQWLAEDRDVHVYFDNDAEGAAPHDALRLLELLGYSPNESG